MLLTKEEARKLHAELFAALESLREKIKSKDKLDENYKTSEQLIGSLEKLKANLELISEDGVASDLAGIKQKITSFKKKILPEIQLEKTSQHRSGKKDWNKKIAKIRLHLKHAEKNIYTAKKKDNK